MRKLSVWAVAFVICLCFQVAFAQTSEGMKFKAAASATFSNNPSLPSCGAAALQDGNPGDGPSIVLIRFKAGCVIPRHWHTANERVIVISGSAEADMKGMTPTVLKSGDFLLLPAKGIHKFIASTDLDIYVMTDTTFDIHYVDPNGKEISPTEALKSNSDQR